jgi:hypothetical protein
MRYPRNYFPVKRCFYKRQHPGTGQPPAAAVSRAAAAHKGGGPDWDYGRQQHAEAGPSEKTKHT